MATPSQYLMDLDREHAAADAARVVTQRRSALDKARGARSEKLAGERAEAGALMHVHPADDPYSRSCRTLCGKVVRVRFAMSPKAGEPRIAAHPFICPDCLAILRAWKLSGNGKPLTFRRLNTWPTKNQEIDTMTKLTPRAAALKAAAEKCTPGGSLHTLLGELMITEQYRATVEQTPEAAKHEAATRRALTVELVKAGLPKEILAELMKAS